MRDNENMTHTQTITSSVPVGIDKISFYTANQYIDLATIAKKNNIDVNKYYTGIGQEKMSMPAHNEDIVTLAANAADPIIDEQARQTVSTVLFATETGIDQSKAAGIYVHKLLNLKSDCRVVELKQACYSCTAAIQMACALVARNPQQSVLVIASDIARYDLDSVAEPTQGCGAVALLITAHPRIVEIHSTVGNYTEDVMDFWRPNYRKTALVDGKFSTKMYIKALTEAWKNYQNNGGFEFSQLSHICYHLPFTRMGQKAHQSLNRANKIRLSADDINEQLNDSLIYSRIIGNSYSAAMFIGLASLLENNNDDLSGKNIGFFSYGSGCVAEFFAGTVVKGYQEHLYTEKHQQLLADRTELTHEEYLHLWHYPDPRGENVTMETGATGKFKLVGIYEDKREYQKD